MTRPTLDEILPELKSAEPISGADAIARALAERGGRQDLDPAGAPKDLAERGLPWSVRLAPAVVEAHAPDAAEVKRLVEKAALPWDDRYASRTVAYWASDERVDRAGDIVRQNWIFDDYAKNPILAYCHDWSGPPIGNGIEYEVRQRSEPDYRGPALWFRALFALAEQSAQADSVFNLVRAGFLRSCSVGFFSEVVIDVKDPAERQRLGLGRYGFVLDQNRLVENSPVPVPANPGAHVVSLLSLAKSRGALRAVDLNVARELTRRAALTQRRDRDEWRGEDERFVAAARLLFPREEFAAADDIERPIDAEAREVRGAVAVDAGAADPAPATSAVQTSAPDPADPAAAPPWLAALDERLTRLEAAVGEIGTGTATVLQDIRDQVERIAEKVGADALATDDPALEAAPDDGDAGDHLLTNGLAELHDKIVARGSA